MDTIFIDKLQIDTCIGAHDWERTIRQPVLIDLELGCDISEAAAADDVAATLDYDAVAQRVTAFVETCEYRLVETLAEHIARVILTEYSVERVTLRLAKPRAVANAAAAGVTIERRRD